MSIVLGIVCTVVIVFAMVLAVAFGCGDLDVDDIRRWSSGRHLGKTQMALEDNDFYKALMHFKKLLRSGYCRERLSRELFHAHYSETVHAVELVWVIAENRALFTDKELEWIDEVEQAAGGYADYGA